MTDPKTEAAVIRCDDNGHAFVYTRQTNAEAAEKICTLMQARAHKQNWLVIMYGSEGLAAALAAHGLAERT